MSELAAVGAMEQCTQDSVVWSGLYLLWSNWTGGPRRQGLSCPEVSSLRSAHDRRIPRVPNTLKASTSQHGQASALTYGLVPTALDSFDAPRAQRRGSGICMGRPGPLRTRIIRLLATSNRPPSGS
jgi:hypothetical protein